MTGPRRAAWPLALMAAAVMCMGAASDPAERLHDPAAEARARTLFREIRCLVCQNESIDDSTATIATDLRRTVREQVSTGRTDGQIRKYLTDRYGEFILLRPPFNLGNALLWIGPFLLALVGLVGLGLISRRRETTEALSADEEQRLKAVLEDGQE
jgi:cytochrome c-type biogenesis protein CcmH